MRLRRRDGAEHRLYGQVVGGFSILVTWKLKVKTQTASTVNGNIKGEALG
jgi:hypothetical protein